jgi:hypothetical protein
VSQIIFLFDDMTSAYDMWCVLINIYECNNQVETEVKDSCSEMKNEQEYNLALMKNVKEGASSNIIDEITIMSKNKEMKSK